MEIPDYQTIMLPLLALLQDGRERSVRDVVTILGNQFALTEEEGRALVPSRQQPVFHYRVHWAKTYLSKAGLVVPPRRGWVQITERGKEVLKQNPEKIDVAFLKRFEGFRAFLGGASKKRLSKGRVPVGRAMATLLRSPWPRLTET